MKQKGGQIDWRLKGSRPSSSKWLGFRKHQEKIKTQP